MVKYVLRIKARKLRQKGKPLNEICRRLAVSKSTASLWCRDIIFSERLMSKIEQSHIVKTSKGRLLGAKMNKDKRRSAIKEADEFGVKSVGIVSKRELSLIATALYWSEGSKSEHSTSFQFVNSDPQMIVIIKKFLTDVMEIPVSDLVCSIQINKIHKKRINKVLSFWKNLLDLSNEQLRKPYFIDTKISKVYENYDNYYGICRLIVRRSSVLKYRMLGLIKALKTILPG